MFHVSYQITRAAAEKKNTTAHIFLRFLYFLQPVLMSFDFVQEGDPVYISTSESSPDEPERSPSR